MNDVFINLGQYIVDWKYHKWQKVVYHSKYNGSRCVDDRLLRKMKETEDAVDNTVLFQKCLPSQRAEQKIHPHWKNEDQHDKTCLIDIFFSQNHGERVGEDQADYRTDKRQQKSQPESL